MLAVSMMDPAVRAVFFAVAFALLVVVSVVERSLLAAGLALFVFVFFWSALAAA